METENKVVFEKSTVLAGILQKLLSAYAPDQNLFIRVQSARRPGPG